MCVLIANLVLIRGTHNFQGWCESVIFLQVASYFLLLYMDSVILVSPISYFYDEFMGSWTAWLGVLFIGASLFVEKATLDAIALVKSLKSNNSKAGHIHAETIKQEPIGQLSPV